MDITGQSEADLQKSQQIARLAVTKSVLLAGDAENALLADFTYLTVLLLLASASKNGGNRDNFEDSDNDDEGVESPATALPIIQQRDSLIL